MSVSVNPKETAIVVVDMQEIEYEYISREDEDEFFRPQRAINELLKRARNANLVVLHVAYGLRIPSTVPMSIDITSPRFSDISPWHKDSRPQKGDLWMVKNRHSLFESVESGIVDVINAIRTQSGEKIQTLIITGMETAVCVTKSAFHATSFGYRVIVPRDTTGDMYTNRKRSAIATFHHNGVEVCNSYDIIFSIILLINFCTQ